MIICYLQEKYNIFHYNFTFVLYFYYICKMINKLHLFIWYQK